MKDVCTFIGYKRSTAECCCSAVACKYILLNRDIYCNYELSSSNNIQGWSTCKF